jgi:hypothetical protein
LFWRKKEEEEEEGIEQKNSIHAHIIFEKGNPILVFILKSRVGSFSLIEKKNEERIPIC